MKNILNHLFEHKHLSHGDAREVLINIAQGKYNEQEIASFMTVYIMRSISVDELAGFRDALLEMCQRVDLNGYETIDLCGTGGDGKNTFNISTLSSFVVAGAGYKVAKHGNYGVSSACGSSNVLEYFGHKFTNDNSILKKEIRHLLSACAVIQSCDENSWSDQACFKSQDFFQYAWTNGKSCFSEESVGRSVQS